METKKIYGQSVLEQIPAADDQDGNIFDDEQSEAKNYSEAEIEAMRSELKESGETNVTEKITVDAMNGVVSSSPVEADEFAELAAIERSIAENDIRGKTLPDHTIKQIHQLTGIQITEDDSARIAQYFESESSKEDFDGKFDNLSIADMKIALGKDITEVIDALSDDEEERGQITVRFIEQIYASYNRAVQYNDDMKVLTEMTRKVKTMVKEGGVKDDVPEETRIENLMDTQAWIEKYMEARTRLDRRNRHLKQDYTIDDIEARTVEEVKACLDDAINMVTLNTFASGSAWCADFRNIKERNRVLKNWITDIKNDPDTLYTFPTNDYYTIEKTRTDVIDYIYGAFVAHKFADHPIPEEYMQVSDPAEYYVKVRLATRAEMEDLKMMSELVLFVIAKTFKYKKLRMSINLRRTLSYTLDMMSKLNNAVYRVKFYELGERLLRFLRK